VSWQKAKSSKERCVRQTKSLPHNTETEKETERQRETERERDRETEREERETCGPPVWMAVSIICVIRSVFDLSPSHNSRSHRERERQRERQRQRERERERQRQRERERQRQRQRQTDGPVGRRCGWPSRSSVCIAPCLICRPHTTAAAAPCVLREAS
jgi:hypothetical protein